MDQTFAKCQPALEPVSVHHRACCCFSSASPRFSNSRRCRSSRKSSCLSLIGVAGTIELVLGALLMIGLFTRIVAFILSGEMAFAYFIGHFPRGFFPLLNNGTAAILFCFACLYLATSAAARSASMR